MTPIQYWRPYDRTGLIIFETSKDSGAAFTGVGVRIGGGFTQGYQALSHENYVTNKDKSTLTRTDSVNTLYKIGSGFNNASANLNIDAQLARGVRLNLALYLSSRHHQETWVKGGYVQFDDLSFLGSPLLDDVMKYLTIRVGHMEINYGDQHFRRSDGGNSIYNPFVENYIIDAFATEIGGDVTFQHSGWLAVAGVTNGEIKGNIVPLADTLDKTPAFYFKAGYDGKVNEDFHYRLTGSMYAQSQSPRNTLYWGDRTGSNYYMVMEKQFATFNTVQSSTTSQAWSGRVNPNFANNVTAFQFNGFLQFGGLEFFGTYDMASGANSPRERDTDTLGNRKMSQLGLDLIFRFGATRNFYVAGRYNAATVEEGPRGVGSYVQTKIDRIAIAAGWFLIDQVFLKAEYMMQNYNDYLPNDYRNAGKISGLSIQAAIGF
ncbi:MAG: hypothetical protein H7X70_04540 [Candidatus Kapabacteria bacterium]|nr:hypothetical protein [Candidatus Kapabacteria bacterium]